MATSEELNLVDLELAQPASCQLSFDPVELVGTVTGHLGAGTLHHMLVLPFAPPRLVSAPLADQ